MDNGTVMTTDAVRKSATPWARSAQKSWPGTEREAEVERGGFPDHRAAIHTVVDLVTGADTGVIASSSKSTPSGTVSCRAARPCSRARSSMTTWSKIRENCHLSPLQPGQPGRHRSRSRTFAGVPQVAVFDTEFQTMPAEAFMYPIPYEVRRAPPLRIPRHLPPLCRAASGGHAQQAEDEVNLVTLHLGNGCSMAAARGKCIDTSMGLTPLAGVMMGTHSGDVDPAILPFLMRGPLHG